MKVNSYLILSIICFTLLLLLCLSGCKNNQSEHDETKIFNTVIIDGVKCYSYVNGLDCMFIPVPEEMKDK